MRELLAVCLLLIAAASAAEDRVHTPPVVPSAAAALAAWQAFSAAPLTSLDRTQPFLDFIRGSGEVHIVLNEALLGWMHEPIDAELKAVLYAAFLGGNMAAQLARGEAGSDDVAGMTSALAAYGTVRTAHPEFKLALFETLAAAQARNELAVTITALGAATQ